MTALVVSIVAGVSGLTIARERNTFRSELEQQAEVMLNTVVAMTSDAFYQRDFDDLERFMDNLGSTLEDDLFSFGRVYQSDGRVVSDAYQADIEIYSLEAEPFGQQLIASENIVYLWEDNQLIVGRAVSIGGDVWGAIAIGLSTDALKAKVTAVRNQGFVLAIFAVVIGIILARILSRSITESLRELTAATKDLAEGNLDQKITVAGEQELADLANSFNLMSSNVRTLVQELQEQAEALKTSEAIASEKALKLQIAMEELTTTQTQLMQSEKMVSLGQLVAGVAHEINNPINFIHGNIRHTIDYTNDLLELLDVYQDHNPEPPDDIADLTEEIELDFLKEDLPKMLQSMWTGTERIQEIVKSLRNFSRLDEAEFKAVDLHEGIDSTLMILENRLKSSGSFPRIEIRKNYGQLPNIECFPGQLNQVFMNLIVNAIDALESKGEDKTYEEIEALDPHIAITTSLIEDNWLRVCIRDNAGGIPPEVQAKLFDPFFTTKPLGKGTGLGLSISYKIITEKHFGHISCNSIIGEGTEFVVMIPQLSKHGVQQTSETVSSTSL